MIFEYFKHQSDMNKKKHGIDFQEAQKIWDDPFACEIPFSQNINDERFLVLGEIDSKHYTAMVTYHDGNIKLISVRGSRYEEIRVYDNLKTR